jgi:hypothetical protein
VKRLQPAVRRNVRDWAFVSLTLTLLAAGCSKSTDFDAQAKKPFDVLRQSVREEKYDAARTDSMMVRIDALENRSLDLMHAARAENDSLLHMFADRAVSDEMLLSRFRADALRRTELRSPLLEARDHLKAISTP